jgi:hypothetical protein
LEDFKNIEDSAIYVGIPLGKMHYFLKDKWGATK